MAGLMWGSVAIFFFPPYLDYQGLMICIMLGLVAGAVTTNPVHPPTLFLYVAGILLPLAIRLIIENDTPHWLMLAMLSIFAGIILVAGRELTRTFMHSLKQRFENIDLVKELSQKTAALEESRYQLQLANGILQKSEQRLEDQVSQRTAELLHRAQEINAIKDTTILALTSLAETRDNETGNHIRRTQGYMRALALQLRKHPRFADFLSDDTIELLYKLAPLHDIGKVGIPDHILLKPGKLTVEEFEIMKTHAALGGHAIAQAEDRLEFPSVFLRIARQIVMGHHEQWNGSGYPHGLRGDDIPIPARLMAVADVYDALTCKRVYKPAMSHETATAIIMEGRGKHFDPDIADAFFAIQPEFIGIAEKYCD
jgi:response regulator RpfG family c-di-GMP phosphodiesterase